MNERLENIFELVRSKLQEDAIADAKAKVEATRADIAKRRAALQQRTATFDPVKDAAERRAAGTLAPRGSTAPPEDTEMTRRTAELEKRAETPSPRQSRFGSGAAAGTEAPKPGVPTDAQRELKKTQDAAAQFKAGMTPAQMAALGGKAPETAPKPDATADLRKELKQQRAGTEKEAESGKTAQQKMMDDMKKKMEAAAGRVTGAMR